MNKEVINSWGMDEFNNLALGDKRLTDRLIRMKMSKKVKY